LGIAKAWEALCGRLDTAVRKYSSNDKDGYNGMRKQATVLRTQVPMQVVHWNIGTIPCNQSTMNTNESQWGGPPWNVLGYWNIWHFLLTQCLDLLRETMDMDKDAIQSANLLKKP